MPASGIKLLDANVWLALAFGDHRHHGQAKVWFSSQTDASCALCRITQMALLRHLTNSRIMGKFVQSQQSAWSIYDALSGDPRVIFLHEPPGLDSTFRRFANLSASGLERWADAYLASFADISHSQLVTFDQGFNRFTGLDLLVLQS